MKFLREYTFYGSNETYIFTYQKDYLNQEIRLDKQDIFTDYATAYNINELKKKMIEKNEKNENVLFDKNILHYDSANEFLIYQEKPLDSTKKMRKRLENLFERLLKP